jgi:asparagine synthase (glutamine-hydrolysing)
MERAIGRMRRRGPNDSGISTCRLGVGELTLGQTRLSVIDLTSGGHQPMASADGRFVLVFNGEIYNYRELRGELQRLGHVFTSDSDTEVLLAAWAQWGADCLPRLIGMFAFAVADISTGSLALARDAFGIKPLFLFSDDMTIAFASEIGPLQELMPAKPRPDLQRAHDFLLHGIYDESEATFFAKVMQLAPGHCLVLEGLGRPRQAPVRWWWPSIEENTSLSFEDAAEAVREAFLENVRLHLRSDVPLGAALSGGIDSSAVVCAIRHLEPDADIRTFSFVAAGSSLDEEYWADLVNQHVGARSHKVRVDPRELLSDIDDMILAQGEPFGSTSIYAQYRVFKLAREHGITVSLDGQGADELLAGYSGYPAARLQSLAAQGRYAELVGFARQWAAWPGRGVRSAAVMALRAFLPDRMVHGLKALTRRNRPIDSADWIDRSYMQRHGVRENPAQRSPDLDMVSSRRYLAGALRNAICGGGLHPLLRHGDRNSMHWSIESRVPFLTTGFAELCLSLPEPYLLSNRGQTKHVFRAAMRGIVPDAILDRKDKIGFATPEQSWLGALGDAPLGWLDAARDIPFLDAENAKRSVAMAIQSRAPFTYQSWRLISYCRWWSLAGMQA